MYLDISVTTEEYRKYQAQNSSPVEEEYLESIKNIYSTVKKKGKNLQEKVFICKWRS